MNILIVAPFFPLPLKSGGHTRLFNLIKQLSSRHIIDFISPITENERSYITELEKFCRNIISIDIDHLAINTEIKSLLRCETIKRLIFRFLSLVRGFPFEVSGFYFEDFNEGLKKLLKSNHYDIIQVELSRMAQYFDKSFYKKHPSLKILVDYDLSFIPHLRRYQCEKRFIFKVLRYFDYKMNKYYALNTWQSFDELVVMSDVDKKKVHDMLPSQSVKVISNGVDLSYLKPLDENGELSNLLFIGGAAHFANVDALSYFLNEIYPEVKDLNNTVNLTIIGEGWEKFRDEYVNDPLIKFTGFVKHIQPYIDNATLMVAPIRIGGGTRLKILEAMALGVPIVSTSVGAEGIPAEDGEHIFLANSSKEFTAKIFKVLEDKSLRKRVTGNAYKLVKENFSWEGLALKLEDVYENSIRSKQEPKV